jgi:hypothetical protein
MRRTFASPHLAACVVAALVPLATTAVRPAPARAAFPGWAAGLATLALPGDAPCEPVPLTEDDALFARDLPGRLARFQVGERHVLARWIEKPSARVHGARDCFRGRGFDIVPEPARAAFGSAPWGVFRAVREGQAFRVFERIEDADGGTFDEVPVWYWSALFGRSRGPWWSFAVVERAVFPAAGRKAD